jgi:hypothetical protein
MKIVPDVNGCSAVAGALSLHAAGLLLGAHRYRGQA